MNDVILIAIVAFWVLLVPLLWLGEQIVKRRAK